MASGQKKFRRRAAQHSRLALRPPPAVSAHRPRHLKKPLSVLLWLAIALLGAWAYFTLALHRGEPISPAFITIACRAISGFHTLIASGTTPKMITRESYARPIGYGAMCLESLVAIMAMIAACTLEPGVYLAMNVKGEAAAVAAQVTSLGFPVTVEHMEGLATEMGEHTLFGRTGGAATLAVGMARIFSEVTHGRFLDIWYHFAIMFEALFILTTLDAGTRVGRYILQDFLGKLYKPPGNTKVLDPNLLASALIVVGWGWFLIQGVRDPLGGINSLWPLFGIANQMLAAIALCLGTTIILKVTLGAPISRSARPGGGQLADGEIGAPKPWLALITLIPLVWLVSVTFTAGVQKIWHDDPRIGFLAQAQVQSKNIEIVHMAVNTPDQVAHDKASKEMKTAIRLYANNMIDAVVTGLFLSLVSMILLLSLREWWPLLSRRKPAILREAEPVWLPDYALKEDGPSFRTAAGTAAIALGLAKELSGEAQIERAKQAEIICVCESHQHASKTDEQRYVEMTERRFNGVTRCC